VHIKKIFTKNFRLLSAIELHLEKNTTVIVGRNNCGKTSLSDLIRRFLNNKADFVIEDFSSASYDGFCAGLKAHLQGSPENEVRGHIPYIELRLHIQYERDAVHFGPLSEFIIDIDDTCTEAIVVCRYALKGGSVDPLLNGHQAIAAAATQGTDIPFAARLIFFKNLKERIPNLFETTFWAEAPNDPSNTKSVSHGEVAALLTCGFINAQRGVDGNITRETDILAKVLEGLFASASLPNAGNEQRDIADGLKKAVEEIQGTIDADFKEQLTRLMPTIQQFGYPGLDGPELQTETILDVKRLLSNHTKIRYAGYSGVHLPESYNGLGFRNLLFILLQLVGFYREYRSAREAAGIHLIFIEEPEAHLHPQMQEVFIRHLGSVAKSFDNTEPTRTAVPWPAQFVVSTHSSHVANETSFEAIRYFVATSEGQPPGVRHTKVKDLRDGLKGSTPSDIEFLHQYLTLTRCDLFFADKAVIIEGTSERLMLPPVIRKLDAADQRLKLGNQYLTIMEVGGAYAHIFFPLLEFLELRSLIITDIDAVKQGDSRQWEASAVHQGRRTSNGCLKHVFGKDVSPAELIAKNPSEKIKGHIRIAYQLPETDGGPCGRTFEDAFMLANPTLFSLSGENSQDLEMQARSAAGDEKKSEFALTYAIKKLNWVAPLYISEGLVWLAAGESVSAMAPAVTTIVGETNVAAISLASVETAVEAA
jgi:putative ATP-dependent endonuclease of OLD family